MGLSPELEVPITLQRVKDFLFTSRRKRSTRHPAVSLFTGAGLSDLGYEQAGFSFVVQAELDERRAALCQHNFPRSCVVQGDLTTTHPDVVAAYRRAKRGQLELLSITPPCQGMSSSNPGRGKKNDIAKRDKRNRLLLEAIPIVLELEPRIVVIENVSQVLEEEVEFQGQKRKLLEAFEAQLKRDYVFFRGVVQMADYGIPQMRKRAIVVAVRRTEPSLETLNRGYLPWIRATEHNQWNSVNAWFEYMHYPELDASNAAAARDQNDTLHNVPSYEKEPLRYQWIADIPPNSGRNAYQNSLCRNCASNDVPEWVAHCPICNSPMVNRPHVVEEGHPFRLIKGFNSSYRRMHPDRPSSTITTNTSHMGSDYKLHPWQNRVLSIRECADLQTIPRYYDWSPAFEESEGYAIREVVGEALPPYFTYLHGTIIRALLDNRVNIRMLEINPNAGQQLLLDI